MQTQNTTKNRNPLSFVPGPSNLRRISSRLSRRGSSSNRSPNNHYSFVSTQPITMSSTTSNEDHKHLDLQDLVDRFKKNVPIKDRRYRLQTYKNCFVGSEAVQWLVTSGTAQTRADAINLGLLMQEAGLIEHCVRDHE